MHQVISTVLNVSSRCLPYGWSSSWKYTQRNRAVAISAPAAIYTLPEVAAVGLTEQAREKYDVAIIVNSTLPCGHAVLRAQGFVKVIADRNMVKSLGVHIIGPAAAGGWSTKRQSIINEITVEEILKTSTATQHASEVMYEAFADVLGMAIHSPEKIKIDRLDWNYFPNSIVLERYLMKYIINHSNDTAFNIALEEYS